MHRLSGVTSGEQERVARAACGGQVQPFSIRHRQQRRCHGSVPDRQPISGHVHVPTLPQPDASTSRVIGGMQRCPRSRRYELARNLVADPPIGERPPDTRGADDGQS